MYKETNMERVFPFYKYNYGGLGHVSRACYSILVSLEWWGVKLAPVSLFFFFCCLAFRVNDTKNKDMLAVGVQRK